VTLRVALRWPLEARAPQQDVADIAMSVDGHVFTRLFDEAENRGRDFFRASAVGLGFWFADNWWRLRWEPIGDPRFPATDWRLRHEMSAASGDTILPPFMIYGVGPRVIIAPILGERVAWGPIRYLQERPLTVTGPEFETGIDELFASVLNACAAHPDAEALSSLVGQLERERGDDELAGWRRLEACLGFDPDKAPNEVIEAMVAFEERLGENGIDEAAVASPGLGSVASLTAAMRATEASELRADFTQLDAQFEDFDQLAQRPWQAAEDAAAHLHDVLNIRDFVRWEDLSTLLQIRWETLKEATATARNLAYAAKDQLGDGQARIALMMVPQNDRRFELARMVGDQIWTNGNGFGVVSRAKTDRQKFQRAFAQELLCPMNILRDIVDVNRPTPEQIGRAARHFRVRDTVIATILVNRGYLPRDTIADWLEAA
jgi:hypothetical protein